MAKFAVGDIIRRTIPSRRPDLYGEVGTAYEVLAIHEELPVVIYASNPGADDACFQLVRSAAKKSTIDIGTRFKPGDKARLKISVASMSAGTVVRVMGSMAGGFWDLQLPGVYQQFSLHDSALESIQPEVPTAKVIAPHDCQTNLLPYEGLYQRFKYCSVCDKKFHD